ALLWQPRAPSLPREQFRYSKARLIRMNSDTPGWEGLEMPWRRRSKSERDSRHAPWYSVTFNAGALRAHSIAYWRRATDWVPLTWCIVANSAKWPRCVATKSCRYLWPTP